MRYGKDFARPAANKAADAVDAAIAWHGGDARAAVATLIGDCQHLRRQLVLAEGAMSVGFARGWRPKTDRP